MSFTSRIYRVDEYGRVPVELIVGVYPEDVAYAVAPLFIFLASWSGGPTKPASVARAVYATRPGPAQQVLL